MSWGAMYNSLARSRCLSHMELRGTAITSDLNQYSPQVLRAALVSELLRSGSHMADTFTRIQRSQIMRSVRSNGTRPEKACERLMRSAKIRFRKHPTNLAGHPDFVLPDSRVAVFVHGCFWHGHEGCKHFSMPSSNVNYWEEKIGRNRRRDRQVRRLLRKAGWRTAVLWECKLRNAGSVTRRLLRLSQLLGGGKKLR